MKSDKEIQEAASKHSRSVKARYDFIRGANFMKEDARRDDGDLISIKELLSEFKRHGFDTSNWDGDEGAEKAIVDGVLNYVKQLEHQNKDARQMGIELLEFVAQSNLIPTPHGDRYVWLNIVDNYEIMTHKELYDKFQKFLKEKQDGKINC